MLSQHEVEAIVFHAEYKREEGWGWSIHPMADGWSVQCILPELNPETGDYWKGRKWYISPFMIEAEVVQTLLLAVLTAEEHEAREKFRYNGVAIFGPHIDLSVLELSAHREVHREPK